MMAVQCVYVVPSNSTPTKLIADMPGIEISYINVISGSYMLYNAINYNLLSSVGISLVP